MLNLNVETNFRYFVSRGRLISKRCCASNYSTYPIIAINKLIKQAKLNETTLLTLWATWCFLRFYRRLLELILTFSHILRKNLHDYAIIGSDKIKLKLKRIDRYYYETVAIQNKRTSTAFNRPEMSISG